MPKTALRRCLSLVKDRSGAAAVEMAIVFPLFLMVVLGTLVYGMYIGATHSTQQLAADSARASIAGLNAAERTSIATNYVMRNAASYPLIFPEKITVEAGPSPGNPDDFMVAISYDASGLPIWGFSAFVPGPSSNILRTAVVRRGFSP